MSSIIDGPKQMEIPGAGRKRIKALDSLCATWREKADEKKEAVQAEKDAAEDVFRELGKRGLESYVYHDGENRWMVRVKDTSKVVLEKVGRANGEGQQAAGGEA